MSDEAKITCRPNGPLVVTGGVPLRRKRAVHSEHGEPLTWQTTAEVSDATAYALCRCGQSSDKPFCDGTHANVDFDGTEQASGTYAERANTLGGSGITVRDDRSICVHAGFCGNRVTNVWKQVADTDDSMARLAVINEVEKCPSGALTYAFDGEDADTEPDLGVQISAIADGPLWVTGSIPVETSTGDQVEARPRMTLCRCGASANKPLCDGAHKEAGFQDG